ncbi:MAG: ADP-ribosylglycohydrolase family protein [Gemmataceae bacterium]
MQTDAIAGAVLGCAVGDAIGLPYEGLSKRRGVRLLGEPDRHRFFVGRGMVSDDTEHTCMVGQSLCADPAGLRPKFGGLPHGRHRDRQVLGLTGERVEQREVVGGIS